MTFLIKLIIKLMIVALAANASFRAMNAMMVHDNATVYFDPSRCPDQLNARGECMMVGAVSYSFVADDIEIRQGTTLTLAPRQNVKLISYSPDGVHYEPFGKWITFLIGVLIFSFGLLLAFGPPVRLLRSSARAA